MRNLFNGISSVLNELISALNNKADISDVPTTLSQLSDDSTHRVVTDTEKTTWNGKANTSDIPTTLSQLSDDSTHRVVTDTEKTTWNNKSDFSGSYNDLSDKPDLQLPLSAASGGTGQTTLNDAANSMINSLSEGTSTPVDDDYYISQYANGGTTYKTYHRRKFSTLLAYIKSKLTASDVGALPLSGGTMTGTTSYTANKIAENYRPEHSSYYTTTAYMTDGNEALVWATKNAVTSFMFVNGEDLVTNVSGSRWRSLTPGLQIKENKVAINKLIDTNVSPAHTLDVNGDICCTNFDATTLKTGDRYRGEHNCNNMVTNGFYYYTTNGPSTSLGASTNDGGVFVQAYSDIWVGQIAIDYRNGRCFFRGKNNGTWSAWQAFKSQADVNSAYSSGFKQSVASVVYRSSGATSSPYYADNSVVISLNGTSKVSFSYENTSRNQYDNASWRGDWLNSSGLLLQNAFAEDVPYGSGTKTVSAPSGAYQFRLSFGAGSYSSYGSLVEIKQITLS